MIEARSIAELIDLAANPPANFETPILLPHPLTFYIARVPGSEDVFFTAVKPQDRNITAEDVQSSIYFCHVNRAEDDELREAVMLQTRTPNQLRTSLSLSSSHHEQNVQNDATNSSMDCKATRRKPVNRSSEIRRGKCPVNAQELSPQTIRGPRPLPPRPQSLDLFNENWRRENYRDYAEISPAGNQQLSMLWPFLSSPTLQNMPRTLSSAVVQDLSMTFIRRDPTSGRQWNIGTVCLIVTGREACLVKVSLSSEGYSTFYRADRDSIEPHDNTALTANEFSRIVSLEPLRRLSPESDAFATDEIRQARPHQEPYTYRSPWGSTCAFSTGMRGRSLKCRQGSREISELRFNLPSKGSKSSTSSTAMPPSPRRPLRSLYSQSLSPNLDDNSDDKVLDLSLGQEKAGGGLRGRQAKLGKLVVHEDGLKMHDLVVAVNAGLFWTSYSSRSS